MSTCGGGRAAVSWMSCGHTVLWSGARDTTYRISVAMAMFGICGERLEGEVASHVVGGGWMLCSVRGSHDLGAGGFFVSFVCVVVVVLVLGRMVGAVDAGKSDRVC